MASVTKIGKGKSPPRAVEFVNLEGQRKRIYLGAVKYEDAQAFKLLVEDLVGARSVGRPPSPATLAWLRDLPDATYEKLAHVDLVEPRVAAPKAPRLRAWMTRYRWQRRSELKPSSRKQLRQTARKLSAYFADDRFIDAITPDHAANWRASLVGSGLSEATVRGYCRYAKLMFRAAVERELLTRNPFGKLKSASVAAAPGVYVTPADADKVLAELPGPAWRVLFGLARFAGLRTPSETHGLKWQDVDFERRRLTVYAVKTDNTRQVPIDPRLYRLLLAAFEAAPEGSERVVDLSANNMPRVLQGAIRAAGLTVWPDLFQNLRRSAEVEWAQRHPQHAVSAWVGHSMAVSERYYLRLTDDVFDRAAGLVGGAEAQQKAQQQSPAPSGNERHEEQDAQDGSTETSGNPRGNSDYEPVGVGAADALLPDYEWPALTAELRGCSEEGTASGASGKAASAETTRGAAATSSRPPAHPCQTSP